MDTIDDIMDNFDFDKVHKTMTLLGWCWSGTINGGGYGVPEKRTIRKLARSLMKEAMESKDLSFTIGTGGFEVVKKTEEDKVYLSLSFVVANWNNYE